MKNYNRRHLVVKSNILYIDGSDLRFCRLLELNPGLTDYSIATLTHTDVRNDIYSQYLREIIFKLFVIPQIPRPLKDVSIENTYWFKLKSLFSFQIDNLYNSFEDVAHVLLIMTIREVNLTEVILTQSPDNVILFAVLEEYHAKLFENYMKWCDFLQIPPFPWGEEPGRLLWGKLMRHGIAAEVARYISEIALYKMIWGEAANLRHTPELLNFLFHWAVVALRENPLNPLNEGSFSDVITVFIQRIRDEAWYGANLLRSPDHSQRLNYDDFNEFFWEDRAVIWLDTQVLTQVCQITPRSAKSLIDSMAMTEIPGNSVKTFSEKRSYAQVLRTFSRIIHCHYFLLHILFWARALWDGEPTASVQRKWSIALIFGIGLSAVVPFVEFSLFELKRLRKSKTWKFLLIDNFINMIRLCFLGATIFACLVDGLDSNLFAWNGIISSTYFGFYAVHGLWPFLHLRISGRMPFFSVIWAIPGVRRILGPRKYIAATAFLAEDFTHVLLYILFWVIPISCKICYWFFLIIPSCNESVQFLSNVLCRPIYFYDFAIIRDGSNGFARFLFWAPIYLFWFFDSQIIFLLFGSLWATLSGYLLRVGYIRDIKTLQRQIIPLVPGAVLFVSGVGVMASETTTPENNDDNNNDPNLVLGPDPSEAGASSRRFEVQNSTSTRFLRRLSHNSSQSSLGLKTPRWLAAGGTPGSTQRMKPKISYTNESDPLNKIAKKINTIGLTDFHHVCITGPADASSRLRKCFGYLWNEIVHSWRMEDIISNSERDKLQFNELPMLASHSVKHLEKKKVQGDRRSCIYLGLPSWIELRSSKISPLWNRSMSRLPVYVYSDLILGFLKACEDYQSKLNNASLRIASRSYIAKKFFKSHLSPNIIDQLSSNLQSSLPLEGLREVIEAFFLYLSRYFSSGSLLVEAIELLWEWVKDKPTRLTEFDLRALRELHQILAQLFSMAEETRDMMANESSKRSIKDLHDRLKTTLKRLLSPATPNTGTLDSVIQVYFKALELCFSSSFKMPSITDSVYVSEAEINYVSNKIQQCNLTTASPLTDTLGLFGAGDIFRPYATGEANLQGIHPSKELLTDIRRLNKIESGNSLPDSVDSVIKLYFRRAHRILTVTEARLKSPEALRRFKFFMNSLLMRVPAPPEIAQMVSMCTLTPYYRECCQADLDELHAITIDSGIAPLDLLRSLLPQEFENFLERVDIDRQLIRYHQKVEALVQKENKSIAQALIQIHGDLNSQNKLFHYIRFCKALQEWASNRTQVLARSVRGIMYYETGLQIQTYLETRSFSEVCLSHDLNRLSFEQKSRYYCPEAALWRTVLELPPQYLLAPSVKSLSRLKFSYVVAAQEFGNDKNLIAKSNVSDPSPEVKAAIARRNGIIELLKTYSSLRVATLEDEIDDAGNPTGRKMSILYKWESRLQRSKPSVKASAAISQVGHPFPRQLSFHRLSSTNPSDGSPGDLAENLSENEDYEFCQATSKQFFFKDKAHMISPPHTRESLLAESNSPILDLTSEDFGRTRKEQSQILASKGFSPVKQRSTRNERPSPSIILSNLSVNPGTPGGLEACLTPPFENRTESGSECGPLRQKQRLYSKMTNQVPQRFSRLMMVNPHEQDMVTQCESPVYLNTCLLGRDDVLLTNPYLGACIRDEPLHGAALAPAGTNDKPKDRMVLGGELVIVYQVVLPMINDSKGRPWKRNPIIGHGKPENQNHAMIFTRGETIQAIDMNMDGYLEESVKLRNLLQEFTANPRMRILGFREHIFSHNVSSISSNMALQESAFVTSSQRLYSSPLRTRMHYGHPDIFDRFFVQTCGSISKASNGINISEDVFAGYNATQRGYTVHHVDYHQVGKGRDVGLQQIFMFETKIAGGTAEQMLSRDLRRLFDGMDFFRMLSLFYSGPGLFFNSLILLLSVFVLLYGRVFMSILRQISDTSIGQFWTFVIAPVTTIQIQLGMMLMIPTMLVIALERGIWQAFKQFLQMTIKLSAFYYNFMMGTKAAVIDDVLIYGGAKYQETGRGFQIAHVNLAILWRFYSISHFIPAIELLLLLSLYANYGELPLGTYLLDTWPIWLMFVSFTWTPFVFNPLGMYYPSTLQDLGDFNRWILAEDLKSGETSWRAWWRAETDRQAEPWWHSKALVLLRLTRFIAIPFGMFLVIAQDCGTSDIDIFIYFGALLMLVGVVILFMREFQLVNPRFNNFLGFCLACFLSCAVIGTMAAGILSIGSVIHSIIAFLILSYGIVQGLLVLTSQWGVRKYVLDEAMMFLHIIFAHIIFFPVLILASITLSFHKIQTRILFNPRFVGVVKTGISQQAQAAKKAQ